ncbi:aldehyde dehydrogenase (NAD+) [Pelagirhabdus alkalitolerans]|uniref:Aldehyde dehydrogenase n=1 Tax=Pelagirhabdus alkalitolerans TaxID=1612202 RepID=A0A1G6JQ04_9BACI|nr:aldehyde dehydrogenase [Pelagirhabdus alkalitolerans]SDC20777.1 aldehyde dehydrogenase (NAD+) [Pelagirhabdus alkalitolerans]
MKFLTRQYDFFHANETRPLEHRLKALDLLKTAIKRNESDIVEALSKDLNKSEFEAYTTEIGILYTEIDYVKKHLKKWMKPKRVKTAITHIGSVGKIYPDPYGVTLIIAPWNYPFQLAIAPLIGAIAGGNTAVIKPSELTPHTADIIETMIEQTFIDDFIAVKQGAVEETQALLDHPFDYIFFTGSVGVGKIVMEKASHNLTPITLELGGKSPAIVHEDASLKLAAKRIAWGKFTNAGQTCVAPDYLYVHEHVKDTFLTHLKEAIYELYTDDPMSNAEYTHIVNDKHFDRLLQYLNDGHVIQGGEYDRDNRVIEPTLMTDVQLDSAVMEDEIFGPILPILTYSDIHTIVDDIKKHPKPLALYLFSETEHIQSYVIDNVQFGGGCINDTIFHLATPHLPFGGVGHSGMGSYHGQYSFKAFTHQKSILKQATWFDLPIRYPNAKNGLKWIKKLMK